VDESRYQTRVGAAVLLTLLAAIVFTIVILPRIEWGRHVRVGVYFRDLGGLRVGAPVVVAGRVVGDIESVDRIAGQTIKLDGGVSGAEPPVVVVRIALRASYAARVQLNSDYFVSSHGPLSERYLEIANRNDLAPARALQNGDALRGIDPPSMDRVLQRMWDNMAVMRLFLDDVGPAAHELAVQLRSLGEQLDGLSPTVQGYLHIATEAVALLDQVETLRRQSGGATTIAHAQRLVHQASQLLEQARTSLAGMEQQLTLLRGPEFARLSAGAQRVVAQAQTAISAMRRTLDQVAPVMANIDGAAQMLARGEGSLMRLMTDPEFPEDTKELGKILKRTPWRIVSRPPDAK